MKVKNHNRDRRIFRHTASTVRSENIPGRRRAYGGTRR